MISRTFSRWWALAAVGLIGIAADRGVLLAQRAAPLPRAPGARIGSVPRAVDDVVGETSVAIDPRDPSRVLVAYQQFYPVHPPFAEAGVHRLDVRVAWSADGGDSWMIAPGTAPPNYLVSGDPSVAIDLHGHAFLAYIAFDRTGQRWYWSKGASRNGIYVRRSLDGGRSWEVSDRALIEYPTMEDPPFQDKGYLIADNGASSPGQGNLYVGWTRYSLDKSEILFSRSTDDGMSWSKPIVINTEAGLPRGSASGSVVGFHAAVGGDGTIYATWPDGEGIVLAISRDGGKTFEPSRRVVQTTLWTLFAVVADFPGAVGLPSIAVDPRANGGRLFVSWSDYRYGDIDIMVSTSEDGGRTWSTPARVNDDPKHDGKDQVMSWLSVDPTDGSASVLFYDRRADSANVLPTITLARSTDGGRSFVNYGWSVDPADPRKANFGDYIGLAAAAGRVYGAWTEQAPPAAPGDSSANRRPPNASVIRIGVADFRAPGRP